MITKKTVALTAGLALMASPALAAGPDGQGADGKRHSTDNPGTLHKQGTPGPKAGLPAKAKAYGRYCKGESKKHVKGERGTPFSRCVTAMAKLAKGQTASPRRACKSESRKHVKGQKRTPFSLCVKGGAKLLRHKRKQEQNNS
jgi:hypothetical protein